MAQGASSERADLVGSRAAAPFSKAAAVYTGAHRRFAEINPIRALHRGVVVQGDLQGLLKMGQTIVWLSLGCLWTLLSISNFSAPSLACTLLSAPNFQGTKLSRW